MLLVFFLKDSLIYIHHSVVQESGVRKISSFLKSWVKQFVAGSITQSFSLYVFKTQSSDSWPQICVRITWELFPPVYMMESFTHPEVDKYCELSCTQRPPTAGMNMSALLVHPYPTHSLSPPQLVYFAVNLKHIISFINI